MGALYQIEFPNGKSYIGITKKTAEERFNVHRYQAKGERTHAIYNALRKYGRDNVKLKTLLIGDYDYLVYMEPRAIVAFNTKAPHGYNMTDGGEGTPNPTAETRAKIGAGHKGIPRHTQPHSAEAKAKMSASRKGKKHVYTAEGLARIKESMIGNKYGLGYKPTKEQKEKKDAKLRGQFRSSASGHANIYIHKTTGLFRVALTVQKKQIHLGSFNNLEDAIKARDAGYKVYYNGR